MNLVLTILLSCPPCSCGSTATFDVTRGDLTLCFSRETGQWVALIAKPIGTNLLAPTQDAPPQATIQADGKVFPQPTGAQPDIATKGRGDRPDAALALRCRWQDWSALYTYHLSDSSPYITSCVAWTYRGAKPASVTGATLTLPALRFDGHSTNLYVLPAAWPAEPRRFASLVPGRTAAESSWLTGHASVIVAHAPKLALSVLVGHELLLDGSRAVVTEGDGCIHLSLRFNTRGLIQPGQTYVVGRQHLRIVRGDWPATLDALADFCAALGNGPPPDSPAWLDRCVIYSGHPCGPIGVSFNAGGGLSAYADQLPRLARLGVTTMWLNPIYTKPPWVYSIRDHRAIAPEIGTPDDLQRFVDRAHGLGQRVWLDLVSHGPAKDSPDARNAPPESWARDKDGKRHLSWGQNLTGDYTHPAWQGFMADVAAYWVERFGIDGYRHDCGHGSSGLNWSPDAPHRPSAAGPFGGVVLSQVVRDRIRKINPDAALFSETGGPVFFRSADLLYDYPFYLACRELTYGVTLEEWIPRMRRWLQCSKLTYPRRGLRGLVRFLENHDTVRSAEFFGVGLAQALTALAVFSQGTPMLYQEQEFGYAPELSGWLALRNRLPALRTGVADYQCLDSSSPGVLPFLRQARTGAAIVAVNLTGERIQTALTWPAELRGRFPVTQLADGGGAITTGENRCMVTIPPYRPIALALRDRPDASLTAPTAAPTTASPPGLSLVLKRTSHRTESGGIEYRLAFRPVSTWFVETGEGVLLDAFVDPHRPGGRPTLTPCWQPLAHGLWDACRFGAMGVRAADGRQVRVERIDVARLADARIEDDGYDGLDVQIVLLTRDDGGCPYVVTERPEPSTLRPSVGRSSTLPGIDVDPLAVTVSNEHYTMRLGRRHGGTIVGLALAGRSLPNRGNAFLASEVYTDWGLYAKGRHVGTREEPKPRLTVTAEGGGKEITFTGLMRGHSWNGVQRGWPVEPRVGYRLTYRVDDSPVVGLTIGLTSTTDRHGTEAFYAFRWQILGATSWSARAAGAETAGRPDAKRNQRVFQSAQKGGGDWALAIDTVAGRIGVRPSTNGGRAPANTFLLDGGADRMHLFAALLNGNRTDLKAGREYAGSIELTFTPRRSDP